MERKKSVLVVDDDEVLVNALRVKFTDLGYEVSSAKSGREGLETLKKQNFDVLITDLHMPDGDGFQLLEDIKSTRNFNTACYVITNLGSDHHCDKAISLGARQCFVKARVTLKDVVGMINAEISSAKTGGTVDEQGEKISR